MFLSDFSIKKPTATIVLIVALMALGLLALSKLRRTLALSSVSTVIMTAQLL